MTNQTHHDVIIIGAGAAGLSAGLVLARAQADVLLIDAGGTILPSSVRTIEVRDDGSFTLTLTDGPVQGARALLVATGLRDGLPLIPVARHRWGTLVHHCPYCHGYEVRGQAIAAICGPAREMSLKQARLLRRFNGQLPNDGLPRSLGCAMESATGLITTKEAGETSVPGVWAAGNVVTPSAKVITAAGAARSSAIAINGWLLQKDLDAGAPAQL